MAPISCTLKKLKTLSFSYCLLFLAIASLSFVSPSSQGEKYVFIVGVADYQGDDIDLNYSDDDALLFYKKMRQLGVKKENMTILLDENATQLNIIKKMSELFLKANENDQVIFFFSGHGDKGYFLPYDYTNVLSHKTVKLIFRQSKAKKKICFADACFSGSIRSKVKSKAIKVDDTYSLKQDKNDGVAVMMSSTGYETSVELGWLKQGLFTYCLLDGLSGKADLDKNNTITITELFKHTKSEVLAGSYGEQTPIIFGNFDLEMPIIKRK